MTNPARRSRPRRRRGVSPVVATILLVAITVVMAAILYVLVGGIARATQQTPLGSTFAFARPVNVTSSAASAGCAASDECYSLGVATAGDGLSGYGLTFGARTPSGAAVSVQGWTFSLVDTSGTVLNASWTGGGRCAGPGCGAPIQGGETLMLDTGASASLYADYVVGVGQGAFSGTVETIGLPA